MDAHKRYHPSDWSTIECRNQLKVSTFKIQPITVYHLYKIQPIILYLCSLGGSFENSRYKVQEIYADLF